MILLPALFSIFWLIMDSFLVSGNLTCPNDISVTPPDRNIRALVEWVIPSPPSDEYRLTFHSHSPGFFPVGISLVTYIYTSTVLEDVAECNFTVNVEKRDILRPRIIFCPGNVVIGAQPGVNSAYVTWEEPVVVDDSGMVTLLGKTHDQGVWSVGTEETVNYNFADPYGNHVHCNFRVQVITDSNPPTIFGCPLEDPVFISYDGANANVSWGEPFAIDESTQIYVHQTHRPGNPFPVGITAVEYVFEDSAGNLASCSFNIRVNSQDKTPDDERLPAGVTVIPVVVVIVLVTPTLLLNVTILLHIRNLASSLSLIGNKHPNGGDCYHTRNSPQVLTAFSGNTIMSTTSSGYERPIENALVTALVN